ncbi:hypothetical protein D9757_010550 [Collybiopsis confluens]|uniref:Uncharacterized protein n=1 Tax=Collybiopsis confluens TaxID=2823264 RepID=A0A8H5GY21_9AGAR|nr:hypothetical protein D9757_010550 [Collybiopsis confluens]
MIENASSDVDNNDKDEDEADGGGYEGFQSTSKEDVTPGTYEPSAALATPPTYTAFGSSNVASARYSPQSPTFISYGPSSGADYRSQSPAFTAHDISPNRLRLSHRTSCIYCALLPAAPAPFESLSDLSERISFLHQFHLRLHSLQMRVRIPFDLSVDVIMNIRVGVVGSSEALVFNNRPPSPGVPLDVVVG